jgi:hypothetical protein
MAVAGSAESVTIVRKNYTWTTANGNCGSPKVRLERFSGSSKVN